MGQKLHHSTPYLTLTTRSRTWFQVSVTLIPRHSTLFTSDDLYVGCAKPFFANASKLGVSHGPPKQPICPKPTSSRTMDSTLGAPSFARNRSGQAGSDTSKVRPLTPLNAVPGLYSLRAIKILLFKN